MANPFPCINSPLALLDARSAPKLTRQMHTPEWPRMLH
jgi:hypothetical protein